MKKILALFILLLASGAALAGLRFYYYCKTPFRPNQPAVAEVTIPEGASFKATAVILERQGVISDPLFFVLLGKIKKAEHSIKAGPYSINLPVSPAIVLDKLVRGEVALIAVTFPEGSTIFDVARIIERAGLRPSAEVLSRVSGGALSRSLGFQEPSLEGVLFPDTYRFAKSMTLDQMLRHMYVRFQDVFARELDTMANTGSFTPRQIVILASLVEKEARNPAERPLIAAVFYNRLKLGMRLDCDPTVAYGVMLQDPSFKGRLLTRHLRAQNGYNTYVNHGLPAGPICNPGLASIRAVLRPADVDYLYFVARNDGTHQFSRTLQEHNRAVQQYQR